MSSEQCMVPLIERCRDIALRDTTAIAVPVDNPYGLPDGRYAFLESYCNLPLDMCDCRRVFLNVVYDGPVTQGSVVLLATIGYGWEDRTFYKEWSHSTNCDKELIDYIKGPILELTGTGTKYSEAVLKLFRDSLLDDRAFAGRLQKHYQMFKTVQSAGYTGCKKRR